MARFSFLGYKSSVEAPWTHVRLSCRTMSLMTLTLFPPSLQWSGSVQFFTLLQIGLRSG